MSVAIYPGTFGPPTLAHQDILAQARKVFTKVYIVVAQNASKADGFSSDERYDMWKALEGHNDYVFRSVGRECAVDWARHVGASHVVRGVRDASDVLGEQVYRKFVTGVSLGGLSTVYFMPPPELQCVSSSAVRQILALRKREALAGWLDPRVTRFCLP